jgi:hypothetical protein
MQTIERLQNEIAQKWPDGKKQAIGVNEWYREHPNISLQQ